MSQRSPASSRHCSGRSPDRLFIHRLRQRPDLLALAGYGLLLALFYGPLLLGLRTFESGDFTDHFLPFSLFQRSEWLACRLPLWNPYTYAGHPFLADVQAAVLYPLNDLLLLLTLPWSSDAARLYWLQVEAVIQTGLAGFFMYLLVRDLVGLGPGTAQVGFDTCACTQCRCTPQTATQPAAGRPAVGRRAAAFLAGCVFAFSGYLTGYPPLQLAILRTAIWLPLVLWLLLRAFQRPASWRWWIGAALAYAVSFLAGHPQTFLHLSYAVAAWIGLLLVSTWRHDRRGLRRQIGGVVAFYGLSLALSAAQWLPSLEFTGLSVRAGVDYDYLSGGFPLADTWQFLLPGLLTYFSPLYVGLVGLALALIAVLVCLKFKAPSFRLQASDPALTRTAFVAYFALLALVALLVSYGRNGFLYPIFYRWLPGWDLFRGQERAAYLVAFGLSGLAGLGAAALPALSRERRRLLGGAFAVAAAAGIVVFYVIRQQPGLTDATPQEFRLAAGLALLWVLAFTSLLWPAGWSRRRSALLVLLLLADLFLANFGTITVERSLVEAATLPPEALAVQAAVAGQGAARSGVGLPGRAYNEYRISDDYGMRVHVEDVWGSSPLRLDSYAALFDEFPLERMWRLAGVQHVLTWRQELFRPSQLLGQWPGDAGDTTYLHRLDEANPRAWVASRLQITGDDEARRLLADGGFDLENTALLAAGSANGCRAADAWLPAAFPTDGLFAAPGNNTIRLERLAPNRLRIDVESERGGLLLVSENWLPGWQATLARPDQPVSACLPVLRADLTLLGLPVPPGASSIDLVYRPASVRIGLLISGLALLVLAGAALWRRRRTDSPALTTDDLRPLQQTLSTDQD